MGIKIQLSKARENPFARSPTLDTVLMVEEFIEKNSGDFNIRGFWENLPKKIMWQTYLVILDYLQNINKIALDNEGKIAYIWSPETAAFYSKRKRIKI